MRMIIIGAAALVAAISPAMADEFVNGYTRQNGTHVEPYMRSSPDGDTSNNWSTRGNENPYTGTMGTHSPSGFGSPSYDTNQPRYR